MRRTLMTALIFGIASLGWIGCAQAETIDCSSNSTDFYNRINSTLNTYEVITATVINGPCRGGFQIPITKSGSVFTASGSVTITDFVQVTGSNITLNGFTIDMTSASGSSGALMVGGPQDGLGSGASAQFNGGSLVNNGSGAGAYVSSNANLVMNDTHASPGTSTTISSNQTGIQVTKGATAAISTTTISNNSGDGIDVDQRGAIQLGSSHNDTPVTALAVTIQNNSGHGLNVQDGAHLEMDGGTVSGNAQSAVFIATSASGNFNGTTVTAATGTLAIQALGGTSLLLMGPTVSGPSGAILLADGSNALIIGSTISTTNATIPALEASGGSSVVITAGDVITASASGGMAIQIDHSSNLMHRALSSVIPGGTNAVETITGAGLVQEQSSMDLGQGLVSSSPSISWTTGSPGISVQQNSSFRVSGGVAITGSVVVQQGSNGFANTASGGTNAITSASCPFTSVPSSHWAAPAKVTPAVPSASAYSSAVSPQCLAF